GTLDVSGGGHGVDITGDRATVANKGGMTVTAPGSHGTLLDGGKAHDHKDGDNTHYTDAARTKRQGS
ncbi:hypothetical protein, partial [Escherichia coli]|uniref:hypothetical protein n=1 Tax=Escherichia coli TaxID=562 RepID=UPI001BB05358